MAMIALSPAALAEALLEWNEEERQKLISDLRAEGYEPEDELDTGEYTLALWKGHKTRNGQPVEFYEMSLNMKGYAFAGEEAQAQHPPSKHPPRGQMLQRVAQWLRKVGVLYVGSLDDRKLNFYHKMFKRYFPHAKISDPFIAFDDSVKPDYFTVYK